MPRGESVCLKVVEKVADKEGIDPAELHPPLHTVIDTKAIGTLFQSTSNTARTNGTVEFQYKGYQIHIDSSGEVQVDETTSASERSEQYTQSVRD